jgi:hypothetical protein
MATELLPVAIERSTYKVSVSFYDETDTPVVPNSVTWKLTDDTGGVINSRSSQSETPSTTVDIVLYGADLSIPAGSNADRFEYLTIYAPYNSTLGSSMPLRHEVKFQVKNLLNVTS